MLSEHMPAPTHSRLREAFYAWAFRAYYHIYRTEPNAMLRFCKALVASSKPVPPKTLRAWWRARRELADIQRKQQDPDTRVSEEERWARVFAAIKKNMRQNVGFRAWELDALRSKPEPVEAADDVSADEEDMA